MGSQSICPGSDDLVLTLIGGTRGSLFPADLLNITLVPFNV